MSLVTDLRIAADALHAPFSKWLAPVLPQGEIFSWHFLAELAVFFCGSAYVAYLARSGLVERNSPRKTRILAMRAPARLKWGAVNVFLQWFVYALVISLTGTGVMMYLGYGRLVGLSPLDRRLRRARFKFIHRDHKGVEPLDVLARKYPP